MPKTAKPTGSEYFVKSDAQGNAAAREEMEAQGVKWLKLAVGDTLLRALPPPPSMQNKETGAAPFFYHTSLHFGLPGSKAPVVCPRKMTGNALTCPICQHAFGLKDAGHERAGNDLLPSWQAYMNVLVLDPKTGEPKRSSTGEVEVYVWSAGRGTLDKIFAQVERREKKTKRTVDITDPDEGYFLEVNRKGTGMEDTKYEVYLADEPSSIMDWLDEWGPELVDLPAISRMRPVDELAGLLTGPAAVEDAFDKSGKAKALPARRISFSDKASQDSDEDVVEGSFREVAEPDAPEGGVDADNDAVARLRKMVGGSDGE